MTLKALQKLFHTKLSEHFPKNEIDTFYYWIVEEEFGLKRIDVSLNSEFQLKTHDIESLQKQLKRLSEHEPIQYILGYTEFYGLRFKVNKDVLIPRPETEQLVEWVIEDIKNQHTQHILDIGTGSGCIAIALKNELSNCKLSAIDVSKNALKMAMHNAKYHQLHVNFLAQDILKTDKLPEEIDVIISNPPYVKHLEKKQMRENVLKYEPHQALFVNDNDPLIFYRKICELAQKLPQPVNVYFEINQYLSENLKFMLKELNIKTFEFRQDFRGNDRMLKLLIN